MKRDADEVRIHAASCRVSSTVCRAFRRRVTSSGAVALRILVFSSWRFLLAAGAKGQGENVGTSAGAQDERMSGWCSCKFDRACIGVIQNCGRDHEWTGADNNLALLARLYL